MEGRKLWSNLSAMSLNMARVVWTYAQEREECKKEDLIGKVAFLNMIVAFNVSLKHKLRFEPYIQYDDLNDLIGHLCTLAKEAGGPPPRERPSFVKRIGELMRIPMARSNPRAELKRSSAPLGNLPLEILTYMGAYIDDMCANGTLELPIAQTHCLNNMQSLHEIAAHTDRIVNTPLPLAYAIAISQITWLYILALPFQLVSLMGWTAIPVTTVSAYIILGLAAIANEIEKPFGYEVNDLPMELYCTQIASDIAIITSKPFPQPREHYMHRHNKPLYPISSASWSYWKQRDIPDIREALGTRASISKAAMWARQSSVVECDEDGSIGSVSTAYEKGLHDHIHETDFSRLASVPEIVQQQPESSAPSVHEMTIATADDHEDTISPTAIRRRSASSKLPATEPAIDPEAGPAFPHEVAFARPTPVAEADEMGEPSEHLSHRRTRAYTTESSPPNFVRPVYSRYKTGMWAPSTNGEGDMAMSRPPMSRYKTGFANPYGLDYFSSCH